MRVFVTGASGFIGSAVVPELIGAGHQVVGLARSDASAQALTAAGAEVQRGSLADLDSLRSAAAAADGVIHLAYIHDFTQYEMAARADEEAIRAMGTELAGSGRPLVITSGTAGLAIGRVATERDNGESPRMAGQLAALDLVEQGVRSSVVRLAPTVHDAGDHGFLARIIAVAREQGVAGYVGDGSNRWSAVHRRDAAHLFRLALEKAPAGSILHGIADEGVPMGTVAEVIGRHLGVPATSITPVQATEQLGFIGQLLGVDMPASSEITRALLGWEPTHPGLIEDLEKGHYFD